MAPVGLSSSFDAAADEAKTLHMQTAPMAAIDWNFFRLFITYILVSEGLRGIESFNVLLFRTHRPAIGIDGHDAPSDEVEPPSIDRLFHIAARVTNVGQLAKRKNPPMLIQPLVRPAVSFVSPKRLFGAQSSLAARLKISATTGVQLISHLARPSQQLFARPSE